MLLRSLGCHQGFAEVGVHIQEESIVAGQQAASIYDFAITPLRTHQPTSLAAYRGKVCMHDLQLYFSAW